MACCVLLAHDTKKGEENIQRNKETFVLTIKCETLAGENISKFGDLT